jgi:23S rRNA (pseudouridine1915-N3)-methyltransferase
MNITLICVGKLKERFWADACAEYSKRLKAYVKLNIVEVADFDPNKLGNQAQVLEREGNLIIQAIPQDAYVVLLAIEGKLISSEDLAQTLDFCALSGKSNIAFIVGGSFGVGEQVYARANEKISLGRITLPHNLARVVVLEQFYRACKINKGEPYHK